MTLEQYAQIGEIIASLAVIASLIYVARELHQNTSQTRMTIAETQIGITKHMVAPVIESREFAELWAMGESNFESLDSTDQQRLILYEWQAINAWSNAFQYRKQNLLSEEEWHHQLWIYENLGQRQDVRAAWKFSKDSYEKPFQEFLSEYLG